MATKEELQSKLESLGVTPAELEGKTKADLEALMATKDAEAEDLRKQSAAANEAIKNATPASQDPNAKIFSMEDMKKMFKQFRAEMKNDQTPDEDDDEGPREHTVRMARLQGKFVLGMKNLNNDPYFPNRIILSRDIFNEQSRANVPHSTFILKSETSGEPNEELTLPIETAFKIATKVVCKLKERKYKDVSEKYGQIEVQEIGPDQYSQKGTGNYVTGKAVIKIESYVVELPSGELVEVSGDVINW